MVNLWLALIQFSIVLLFFFLHKKTIDGKLIGLDTQFGSHFGSVSCIMIIANNFSVCGPFSRKVRFMFHNKNLNSPIHHSSLK